MEISRLRIRVLRRQGCGWHSYTVTGGMLRPSALPVILSGSEDAAVKATLLCNLDGSLLCAVGDERFRKFVSAIVANLWTAYEANALGVVQAECMEVMFADCEGGQIGIARVCSLLLCVVAEPSVEPGQLRRRLESVAAHLKAGGIGDVS